MISQDTSISRAQFNIICSLPFRISVCSERVYNLSFGSSALTTTVIQFSSFERHQSELVELGGLSDSVFIIPRGVSLA